MGLFALFCKCRACRPSQQDSSDAALLQSLRGQLEKLIVNGKTRFNILRAALWRKQAEDKFNDFVNEERLRRGEAAAKSSRERAGFFGKLVMRAKMNVGKVSLFDLVSMLMGVKRSKDSKIAATGEVASYADVFEELALPKTPRNRKVDARSKKRVEHSGHKLRDAAATVFVELTTEILTLKGRCRVHTTGCAFDAALHGWRFLHPELPSTVKFEFELTEDGPLELRLRDFQSPWTDGPCAVDVYMNGEKLVSRHIPPKGPPMDLIIPLQKQDRRQHTVEVVACADAVPWGYLLKSLYVGAPHLAKSPPTAGELQHLVASLSPAVGPETDERRRRIDAEALQAQRGQASLLAAYRQGTSPAGTSLDKGRNHVKPRLQRAVLA